LIVVENLTMTIMKSPESENFETRKVAIRKPVNSDEQQSSLKWPKEIPDSRTNLDFEGAPLVAPVVGKLVEEVAPATSEVGLDNLVKVDISIPMEVESRGVVGDRIRSVDTVRCGDAGSGDVGRGVEGGDGTRSGDTVRCGEAGSGDVAGSSRIDGAISSSEVFLRVSRPPSQGDEEEFEEDLLGDGGGTGDCGEGDGRACRKSDMKL
jgi:hypothetical protein